jgi:hypothetical protein
VGKRSFVFLAVLHLLRKDGKVFMANIVQSRAENDYYNRSVAANARHLLCHNPDPKSLM